MCGSWKYVTQKRRVELRQWGGGGGGYSFHLPSSDVLLALAPVVAAARKLIPLIASLRLPEHKDKLGKEHKITAQRGRTGTGSRFWGTGHAATSSHRLLLTPQSVDVPNLRGESEARAGEPAPPTCIHHLASPQAQVSLGGKASHHGGRRVCVCITPRARVGLRDGQKDMRAEDDSDAQRNANTEQEKYSKPNNILSEGKKTKHTHTHAWQSSTPLPAQQIYCTAGRRASGGALHQGSSWLTRPCKHASALSPAAVSSLQAK